MDSVLETQVRSFLAIFCPITNRSGSAEKLVPSDAATKTSESLLANKSHKKFCEFAPRILRKLIYPQQH